MARRRVTLTDVVVRGDERTAAAWAAGEAALDELRDELGGTRRIRLPAGVHDREAIDNLRGAAVALAAARPGEYLAAFDDPAFHTDTFVLGGLGAVDHPRAAAILVAALRDGSELVRVDAAIALAGQHDPVAADALAAALDDPAYLVRYHALAGLAVLAEERSDPALAAFERRTDVAPIERSMAAEARRAVATGRAGPG